MDPDQCRDCLQTRVGSVSLREHVEARLDAMREAIDLARVGVDQRLEGMNQFREQLREQATHFVGRSEFEASMKTVESELRALREFRTAHEAKASQASVILVGAISLLGLILSVIGLVRHWA